jgi:hypothetical protein
MRKLLAGLFCLFAAPALAGVPCTPLPFNLQNGQVADATQVMANYNFIISCLANAAAAGANSDITSLSALTAPIPPALGGTSTFVASSPSTGTANAQVVSTTLPNYVQTPLTAVVFIAGFTNTGPMTTPSGGLTVGSTPQLTVVRRTTDGLQPLAGGEIIAGTVTAVVYDGTRYQLVSNISPFPIGTVQDTIATVADNGFLLLNGGRRKAPAGPTSGLSLTGGARSSRCSTAGPATSSTSSAPRQQWVLCAVRSRTRWWQATSQPSVARPVRARRMRTARLSTTPVMRMGFRLLLSP